MEDPYAADIAAMDQRWSPQDFMDAVNNQMIPHPQGEVSFENEGELIFSIDPFVERVRAKRQREYELFVEGERKRKRREVIQEELDWLHDNQLFRGQGPDPGEDWVMYEERVRKRQAEANLQREYKRMRYTPPIAHYPPGYVGHIPNPLGGAGTDVYKGGAVAEGYNIPGVNMAPPIEQEVEATHDFSRPVVDVGHTPRSFEEAGLPVNPDYYSNPFSPEAIEDMLSKTRESPFSFIKKRKYKAVPIASAM